MTKGSSASNKKLERAQKYDEQSLRWRYRKILRFAALNLAQTAWYELLLPRIGLTSIANKTRNKRMRKIARRFYFVATDLGGLMIKLGQFLSTRLDVLPPEITKELEALQDAVAPVDFEKIRNLAEKHLGAQLAIVFDEFDEEPIAAASLGQVHRAKLTAGSASEVGFAQVVVKIQRPGITEIIDVDLAALRRVAVWLSRIKLISNRADAPALLEEFAATTLEEIDYLNEAQNCEHFGQLFANEQRVQVPLIVWERTTKKVLTMQDVSAIKINDLDSLVAAGINPGDVANEFAAIMFDQVFTLGYFHADPHPGNVFVTLDASKATGGKGWHLTFIDFGMMGKVPDNLGKALRATLIAAAARDGRGMVAGVKDLGVLLPSADTLELERAMTKVFERFGGMGFAELQKVNPSEYIAFASQFTEIVRALPFQFPENFLLVLRALSLTSGMCSTLDRDFNIWNAVEPYAGKLVADQGRSFLTGFASDAVATATVVARLPGRVDDLLNRVDAGLLNVRSTSLEKQVGRLIRVVRRLIGAVLFSALLIAGLLIHGQDSGLGNWLIGASAVALVYSLWPVR